MEQYNLKLGKSCLLAISLIFFGLFSQTVVGQVSDEQPIRTIYPCDIKLKAKAGNFVVTYSYWATADAKGKIAKLTRFQSENTRVASQFVDGDNFTACIKKWTLEPNGKYILQFRVTTTSVGSSTEPRNYMMISGPGESGQTLKIELPFSKEDTLIVQDEPTKPTKSKTKN